MSAHGWTRWVQVLFLGSLSVLMLVALVACDVEQPSAAGAEPTTTTAPAATTSTPSSQPTSPTSTTGLATSPPQATPTASPAPTATPSPSATNTVASHAAIGTWQTYHNKQVGYSLQYPANWAVKEQTGADGVLTTTFTPPRPGAGISVLVQAGGAEESNPTDLPNQRCQQVTVAGMRGLRCFDTIAFSLVTTLTSQGKTFTIVASGKGVDRQVYQHLLDTFTITP